MAFSKEDVLNLLKPTITEIEALGAKFYLRSLSIAKLVEVEALAKAGAEAISLAKVVAAALCDADGHLLFPTLEDVEALAQVDGKLLIELFHKVMAHVFPSDESLERAEKKS